MGDVFYVQGGRLLREKFSPAVVKKLYATNRRMWIDLTGPTADQVATLKAVFGLHPVTVEDIISLNTRTKIENFKSYLFVILYGVTKEKNVKLREIDFVLGRDYVITTHRRKVETFEQLKDDQEELRSLFHRGTDFIMHKLVDGEVDNFIPVLEILDDVIDGIEEQITRNPERQILEKILDLKKRIHRIKKILIRQQEKISFLAKNKYALISPECQTYFLDVYDHFYTVTDMIEDYKETLSSSFDAYMSSVSNRMNEVMKVLSIMATVMLPLSVVSGIYGMNFVLLPGAEHPAGFWAVIALMLAIIATMVGYFRHKHWF